MRPDTLRHYHFGVNFILAPFPDPGPAEVLAFQQALAKAETDIVFDVFKRELPHQFVMGRKQSPLEVRLGRVGEHPVGQLLIIAPEPARLLQDFEGEATALVTAYEGEWGRPAQVLRRDCTIRHLYAVREPHAFQFLWENRLGQSGDALSSFQRPVLGGGLRFVMTSDPAENAQPDVEVKIESLLNDSSMLFVETSLVWKQPAGEESFEPVSMLRETEDFLVDRVCPFILGDKSDA